mgnify:FL=1
MKKIGINLIPFLLTIFIIYLSYNGQLWLNFWATLNISPVIPPFSDLDSILKTLLSRNFGFNVYLENPYDPTHGVYLYPSIWLDIFEFLKLSTQIYFKAFNFIIIFIYFFIIQDLYIKNTKKIFRIFMIIFFFSTTNFLILERLNIEIIIFSLIYFATISKNYFLKVFFFIFALAGKVFPIFSIFLFIKNKKQFLLIFVLSFSYLLFIREEIYFMSVNIIEYARIFAYGSGSVAKAMYYFSKEYNLFINDENYIYLKLSIVFLFATIAIILIKINFIFGKKKLHKDMNLEDRLFLAGGGIYLGTFIFSANVDYRLVFLLLTFTYILNINNLLIKYIYIFSCTMIFNSFFFEIQGGDPYSIRYYNVASFIYSLKFIIFVIICYYFGSVINKYLKINPKKINFNI